MIVLLGDVGPELVFQLIRRDLAASVGVKVVEGDVQILGRNVELEVAGCDHEL